MFKIYSLKISKAVFVVYLCLILLAWVGVTHSLAAYNPLQITNIKPAGTGNPAISSFNRIFRAYPSVAYNIRPAVIGGMYPYSFSLSGEPAGMTIDENTGEISWPSPTGTTGTITLTVTDAEASQTTAQWVVTSGTSGFIFIDTSHGGTESGSITEPYNTLDEALAVAGATDILYFRTGTYTFTASSSTTVWVGLRSSGYSLGTTTRQKPGMWLGYPGESVTINMQDQVIEPRSDVGINYYFDNLTFTNMLEWGMVTETNVHYFTVRRCDFNDLDNVSAANQNQGFIFTLGDNSEGYYSVYQDNSFHDRTGGSGIGSLYYQHNVVIEDNDFYDQHSGPSGINAFISIKATDINVTVRHNTFDTTSGVPLGAEVNSSFHNCENIEICFNFFNSTGTAHRLNTSDGVVNFYYYRNTTVGDVIFKNLDGASCDGPYYLKDNIIINSTSGISYLEWSCTNDYKSCVIQTGNVLGTTAQGMIDSDGYLTSSYAEYNGIKGWTTISNPAHKTPKILKIQIQ